MDDLLDTVSAIYDAGLDSVQWNRALDAICALTQSAGFNVFVLDHKTGNVPFNSAVGIPDEIIRDYNAHYVSKDPGIDFFQKNPGKTFYYNYLHTSEENIDRDEYYSWLQSNGGARYYLATTHDIGNQHSIISTAQRDRAMGHAQQGDMDLMACLSPHIDRAVRLNQRLQAVDLRIGAAYEALNKLTHGICLLDDKGRTLFLNDAARKVLSRNDGLTYEHGTVAAKYPNENRKLWSIVRDTLEPQGLEKPSSKSSMSVYREGSPFPYVVEVLPLNTNFRIFTQNQPAAMLVISDPDRRFRQDEQGLMLLYGLTKREAELALLLARGDRYSDVCQKVGITENTLRTHRKNLYAKIGVETQTQLAYLIGSI